MASRKILQHTVKLLNYLGEVEDEARYQVTVISNCYCPLLLGTTLSSQGRNGNDSARLYAFDAGTKFRNEDGQDVSYIPYSEWKHLEQKDGYWTISDDGNDYILAGEARLRITQAVHRKNGGRRMWHWEVDCK